MNNLGRWLWVAGVALIVWATLLPGNEIATDQMPARWCLACGDLWLADAISNVLLFVPLGATLAAGYRAWPWWRITLVGCAVSLAVEGLQSVGIPPARSPALADVVSNTLGTMAAALSARHWRAWLLPAPARAGAMALGWAALACVVFVLTALATGPRVPSQLTTFVLSRFNYAPGYGWYGGAPTWGEVNGTRFPHRGTGPIVVEAQAEPAEVRLRAEVVGGEAAGRARAIVYLHTAQDTGAVAMLAQHDEALLLRVTRRASAWGLRIPDARIEGAFAAGIAGPRLLMGEARRDRLTVGFVVDGIARERTLWFTPIVGWSMLQGVVGFDSPLALVVSAAWLCTLVCPIGWYAGRAARPALVAAAGVGMVVATWVGLGTSGVAAHSTLSDWALLSAAAGFSWFLSRRWVRRTFPG